MKWLVIAIALVGCDNNTDPRWELHHDRIIAVRVTPPHLLAGQTAVIDSFDTSGEYGVAVQLPTQVGVAPTTPAELAGIVSGDPTGWIVTAPTDDVLDDARTDLGLAAGAPVPVELTTTIVIDDLNLPATKLVWFGDQRDNPVPGPVTVNGVAPTDAITVPYNVDVPIAMDIDPSITVNWFTSCGSLDDDDNEHAALLHVNPGDELVGQFAVVVRDDFGGVGWESWTMISNPPPTP